MSANADIETKTVENVVAAAKESLAAVAAG